MPLRNWFRPPGGSPNDRLAEALRRSKAGDSEAALTLIQGNYGDALQALKALQEPIDTGWLQLAAWLEYRAGRMGEAAATAEKALSGSDEPATWNLLGRIRIWLKHPASDAAFERAATLRPDLFARPHRVSHKHFSRLAEEAFALIPEEFQALLSNALVVVDDLPTLESVREGEDPDLLGIYEGATALERDFPQRIVLYQRNHENICADETELVRQVQETMLHEVGHHFGMGEDELPY